MAKTQQQWAEYYGWAITLLKSDNSLWNLFQKAIKGNWTSSKFTQELKNTAWYKKYGETARKALALKYTDPNSWKDKVRVIFQEIQALAGQMGVRNVNWQTYWDMAEDAFTFGWSNAKLRQELAKHLSGKTGTYGGEAEQARTQLEQYAFSMGIKLDSGTLHGWIKGIINGTRTVDDYRGYIQKMAMSAFPALAEQIKGGMSVRDVADPYMNAMTRILEINGDAMNLDDPLIRSALATQGQDGKPPTLMPIWEFENKLRKDPRWLKTNNARQSLNSTARTIGQMFGMTF